MIKPIFNQQERKMFLSDTFEGGLLRLRLARYKYLRDVYKGYGEEGMKEASNIIDRMLNTLKN